MGDSLNVSFLKTTVGDLDQFIKDAAGDDGVLEREELCNSPLGEKGDDCSSIYKTIRDYIGFRYVEEKLKETGDKKPVEREVFTSEERTELEYLLKDNYGEKDVEKLMSSYGFPNVNYFSKDRLEEKLAVLVGKIFDIDDLDLLVSALSNPDVAVSASAKRVIKSFVDLLPVKNEEFIQKLADPGVWDEVKREIWNLYREWNNPETFLQLFEVKQKIKNEKDFVTAALDTIAISSPENFDKVLDSTINQWGIVTRIDEKYAREREKLQLKYETELKLAKIEEEAIKKSKPEELEETVDLLADPRDPKKAKKTKIDELREQQGLEREMLEDAYLDEKQAAQILARASLQWLAGRINLKSEAERDDLAAVCVKKMDQSPTKAAYILSILFNIHSYNSYSYLKELLDTPRLKHLHYLGITGLGRQYALARDMGDYRQEGLLEMHDYILNSAKFAINTQQVISDGNTHYQDGGRSNLSVGGQQAWIDVVNKLEEDESIIGLVTRTDSDSAIKTILANQLGINASTDPKQLKDFIISGKLPADTVLLTMWYLGKIGTPEAGEILNEIVKKEEEKLLLRKEIDSGRNSMAEEAEYWEGRNISAELKGYVSTVFNKGESHDKKVLAVKRICAVGGPEAQVALDEISVSIKTDPTIYIGYAIANVASFNAVATDAVARVEGNAQFQKEIVEKKEAEEKLTEDVKKLEKVTAEVNSPQKRKFYSEYAMIVGGLAVYNMPRLEAREGFLDKIDYLSRAAENAYYRESGVNIKTSNSAETIETIMQQNGDALYFKDDGPDKNGVVRTKWWALADQEREEIKQILGDLRETARLIGNGTSALQFKERADEALKVFNEFRKSPVLKIEGENNEDAVKGNDNNVPPFTHTKAPGRFENVQDDAAEMFNEANLIQSEMVLRNKLNEFQGSIIDLGNLLYGARSLGQLKKIDKSIAAKVDILKGRGLIKETNNEETMRTPLPDAIDERDEEAVIKLLVKEYPEVRAHLYNLDYPLTFSEWIANRDNIEYVAKEVQDKAAVMLSEIDKIKDPATLKKFSIVKARLQTYVSGTSKFIAALEKGGELQDLSAIVNQENSVVSKGMVVEKLTKEIKGAMETPEEAEALLNAVIIDVRTNRGNLASEEDPDRPQLIVYRPAIRFEPSRIYNSASQTKEGEDLRRRQLIDYFGGLLTSDAKLDKKAEGLQEKYEKKGFDYCGAFIDVGIVKESQYDEATGEYVGGCESYQHGPSDTSPEGVKNYFDVKGYLKGIYKKAIASILAQAGGDYSLKYLEEALVNEKDEKIAAFMASCISSVYGDKLNSFITLNRVINREKAVSAFSAIAELGELSRTQADLIAVSDESLNTLSDEEYKIRSGVWRLVLRIQDYLHNEEEIQNGKATTEEKKRFSTCKISATRWPVEIQNALHNIDLGHSLQKNSEGRDLPYHLMEALEEIEAGSYRYKNKLVANAIGWFSDIDEGSCPNCVTLNSEVGFVMKVLKTQTFRGQAVSEQALKRLVDVVVEIKGSSAPVFLFALAKENGKLPLAQRISNDLEQYINSKLSIALASYPNVQQLNCFATKASNISDVGKNVIVEGR